MPEYLSIDKFHTGFIVLILVIIVAVAGQIIVKKLMGRDNLVLCHEVAGYYLSIVGALYAVTLGLVVFDSMSKFQATSETVEQEASAIVSVYTLADQLPAGDRTTIKALAEQYVDEVIDNEWSLMERGDKSMKARYIVFSLLEKVKAVEPVTENQKGIFPVILEQSLSIWNNRRLRTNQSDNGIASIEWVILISGAVITVIFTYFFTISIHKVQLFMTGMVTAVIAMNLYLVLLFGEPFSGDLKISHDPFLVAQKFIDEHHD